MKKDCKHKTKHTSMQAYFKDNAYFIYPDGSLKQIIVTWCADCGKKLKTVVT